MSAASRIIQFAYTEHKEYLDTKNKKRHQAKCNYCRTIIAETSGTTSNFTRHIQRVHPKRYTAYTEEGALLKTTAKTQQKLTTFVQQGASKNDDAAPLGPYKLDHWRQRQITDALIKELIVGCSLPLSLVDNPHFRAFMKVLDPRYTIVSRVNLSYVRLPAMFAASKRQVASLLANETTVSLTADIWSDRTMRSFLGVTAHIMGTNPRTGKFGLMSLLLTCRRFTGSHTGVRIAEVFDRILEDFNIETKVDYIVTDNAANMKAAFKVRIPLENEDVDEEGEDTDAGIDDDGGLWQGLADDDADRVDQTLRVNSKARLPCFAHTLQLVINDGMKETKTIGRAIAKSSKLATFLHRSTVFKERFEEKCVREKGPKGRTIPAANATRWNSTFHQLKSLLSFDEKALNDVCDTNEFRHAAVTHKEWLQLTELCEILEPFAEATNLTQGDQGVTISTVVPQVLDLNTHLQKCIREAKSLKSLATTHLASLRKRFRGIFINCSMWDAAPGGAHDHDDPFGEKVHLIAAVLDPRYMMHWIDADVVAVGPDQSAVATKAMRQQVKDSLAELIANEAEALSQDDVTSQTQQAGSTSSEEDAPAEKVPRLVAKYKHLRKRRSTGDQDSPRAQLTKYMEDESAMEGEAVNF